jgi:hypothetical protein
MGAAPEPLHPGQANSRYDNMTGQDRRMINAQDYAPLYVPFRRRGE